MRREKSRDHLAKGVMGLVIFCFFILPEISGAEQEESVPPANSTLKLNSYVQVRHTHWDAGSDGFRIRRARFGFKGELLKNFNFNLQVDGTRSSILLDAAVEISSIPFATLSFGQFKVPFSLENLTPSSALDLVNRSQTVEELCPARDVGAAGRDIGVTASGKFSILEYTLGVFNGSGINRADTNDQKDIVGRLILRPFNSLAIGFSHYIGDQRPYASAVSVNRDRSGVDVFFSQGPVFIKGEYIFARDDQAERSGWYLRGGYFFIKEKLQGLVNYDSYDRDLDLAANRMDVLTLGVSWFFSRKTKLQVNYEHHRDEFAGTTDNVFLAQFQAYFEK
jgi:phosphate-selective porin OprO/OprP